MKKLLFVIFFVAFIVSTNAQQERHRWKNEIDKYEQLEKVKLIEVLNLDEETTLKFFARRNESKSKMREINDELHKLMDKVGDRIRQENKIDDQTAVKYITRIQELEKMHHTERENFLKSVENILTKEQMLKYLLFENRFRDEVRKKFFSRKSQMVD